MTEIHISGSYTAAATDLSGEEIKITTKRKDPLPPVCRELIARGVDPQSAAHVTRDGKAVWKRDRTVAAWAAIDISEEDRGGVRERPYRAYEAPIHGTPPA